MRQDTTLTTLRAIDTFKSSLLTSMITLGPSRQNTKVHDGFSRYHIRALSSTCYCSYLACFFLSAAFHNTISFVLMRVILTWERDSEAQPFKENKENAKFVLHQICHLDGYLGYIHHALRTSLLGTVLLLRTENVSMLGSLSKSNVFFCSTNCAKPIMRIQARS